MPFSHHSHSGEFCPGHARDSLEDVVKMAISRQFRVLALTEHMPRHDQDRYPEEITAGTTLNWQFDNEASYYRKAMQLRAKYRGQIELLIGFEGEWCGQRSQELIERSLMTYSFDFFIGSIHHVSGIPIDYDHKNYEAAKKASGDTDEGLFETFFDEQLQMLQAVKPPVVGHFDLIRLLSQNPNIDWRSVAGVWKKILRNLDFVSSYGGLLEINTSALRKGLNEPYPKSEICQAFLERHGRFCLSDDSHGTVHIATNYDKVLTFLQKTQIDELTYLTSVSAPTFIIDQRFPNLEINNVLVSELIGHATLEVT